MLVLLLFGKVKWKRRVNSINWEIDSMSIFPEKIIRTCFFLQLLLLQLLQVSCRFYIFIVVCALKKLHQHDKFEKTFK